MARRIVLLAGSGNSTRICYHFLAERFDDVVAVIEEPVARVDIAKRRARRLGWRTVSGQMAFVGLVVPVLERRARRRVEQIVNESGFDRSPIPSQRAISSVNSPEAIATLKELDPAVIVVNGTRIISTSVLSSSEAPFVNTHAGITPRYRGVHGGYWALRDSRPDLVGTTVHLVDAGIDTGAVLGQGLFEPGPSDSFATYPYLHLASGLPVLAQAVEQILAGRPPQLVPSVDDSGISVLRWHPTAWDYLRGRLAQGVR